MKTEIPNPMNRENVLLMRQSPRWMQFFAIFMMLVGGGMISAAYLIKIDEMVTAVGILKASGGREDVVTAVSGRVAEIYVKNGEKVKKGDLLLKFDTEIAQEQLSLSRELIELEKKTLQQQIKSLNLQKETLNLKLLTQKSVAEEYKSLNNYGGISRMQYHNARDRVLELENQLLQLDINKNGIELNSNKRIRDLQSRIKSASQQIKYQNVLSQSNGIVFDIKTRVGGVIKGGQTILGIVPTNGLTANVSIPNRDIGFVAVGQEAKVKVDAYPSNRYGELDGKVSLIGADVLEPDAKFNYYRFPVTITLNKHWLEAQGIKIPLRAGMSITTNLKIRERRIISVVTDFFSNQLESIKALRNN